MPQPPAMYFVWVPLWWDIRDGQWGQQWGQWYTLLQRIPQICNDPPYWKEVSYCFLWSPEIPLCEMPQGNPHFVFGF